MPDSVEERAEVAVKEFMKVVEVLITRGYTPKQLAGVLFGIGVSSSVIEGISREQMHAALDRNYDSVRERQELPQ